MANTTTRRGKGFEPRAVKIKAHDGAQLRVYLKTRHGYDGDTGIAALVSGELLTVLLPDDEVPQLLAWLDAQAAAMRDTDILLSETITSLAKQLRRHSDGQ